MIIVSLCRISRIPLPLVAPVFGPLAIGPMASPSGTSKTTHRMQCHVRVAPIPPCDVGDGDDEQNGLRVTTDASGRRGLEVPSTCSPGGEKRRAVLCKTRYDSLHDGSAPDEDVFERVASPLLEAATAGEHACLFAYGQTGTGKTHNMCIHTSCPRMV